MAPDASYCSLWQRPGMEHSVGDPAVVLLHSQAAACGASFKSIVDSIPDTVSGNDWHGTTRHVWDEERTRFIVWCEDLSSVLEEVCELDPAQAIKIATSNVLANLRDLADDLIEVLVVANGTRLPLEEQESDTERINAIEGHDEQDSSEMVERLDTVSSTINVLTRMLKLQYSYALTQAAQGVDASSAILQTEGTAYPHRYGRTDPSRELSGLPDTSVPEFDSKAAVQGADWTLSRLEIPDNAPAMVQPQSSALHPISAKSVHGRGRKNPTQRRSVPSDRDAPIRVDSQPSAAVQMVRHTETFKLMPRSFFKVGRVVMLLWAEPAGESGLSSETQPLTDASKERVYAKVRRFIVVAQMEQHALAVPVVSYKGMGTSVRKNSDHDHAIAYMGPEAPQPVENEGVMLMPSIRIVPDDPTEQLDSSARINYGKLYTIEMDVKAKGVGMVHEASLRTLFMHQQQVLVSSENSSQGMSGTSEESAANAMKKRRSTRKLELIMGDLNIRRSVDSQAVKRDAPAPALRSAKSKERMGRGSDSGYGDSRATTGTRSVTSSLIDASPAERVIEDDDLGPGLILTFIDQPKLEVPVIDPDNPSPEQYQALSDSTFQLLYDNVLAEQKRRLQLGSTQ